MTAAPPASGRAVRLADEVRRGLRVRKYPSYDIVDEQLLDILDRCGGDADIAATAISMPNRPEWLEEMIGGQHRALPHPMCHLPSDEKTR